LKVIKEMFEASVDGQPYDTERWGQYFRPAGVNAPGGSTGDTETAAPATANFGQMTTAAPVAKAPVAETPAWEDEPAEAAAPVAKPAASGNAQDILAMIRARQKQ
jgi:hypothetical protein